MLQAACPPELRVLLTPFALRTALTTEVQPDVLVARYHDLPVAPVLVAEALSARRGCSMAYVRRDGSRSTG